MAGSYRPSWAFGDDVHRGFRVLHGFQLADGRRLDAAAVARAVREADALPYSDRADWAQKALRIMRTTAGQAGGLDTLLLAEVVERLRRFTRHGLSGQRSVATHATGLGLAADEAGLLAAVLPAEDRTAAVQQEAEEKLNAGQLRAAERLAARLPASDPLRARPPTRRPEPTCTTPSSPTVAPRCTHRRARPRRCPSHRTWPASR